LTPWFLTTNAVTAQAALVLSDDAHKLLLQKLQPQVKRLLLLKPACNTGTGRTVADIPDAPASWLLPARDITPVSSVTVEWEVDLAAIKQVAQDSASHKKNTRLSSTTSCLLGGVMWGIDLKVEWIASKQGSTIGLFARAKIPPGTYCRCTIRLKCGVFAEETSCYIDARTGNWGWPDYFDLGPMSGGFDEAAWDDEWPPLSRRLPATGSIKLQLTVSDVGM
jgi:hypothetical protein